jgi:hypothetical protein
MAFTTRSIILMGVAIFSLTGCVSSNEFSEQAPGTASVDLDPTGSYPNSGAQGGTGSYPNPSPSPSGHGHGGYPGGGGGCMGGSGGYPGSTPTPTSTPTSGSGNYPTSITITPNAVCAPDNTPSSQATTQNTTNLMAVLYKGDSSVGNFAMGSISIVQSWSTASETSSLYSQVAALKPFQLSLNQALTQGIYTVVLYDASRVSTPPAYNWNNSNAAVAPVLDTIAGFLEYTSVITVDSNGNVSAPSSFNVVVGEQGQSVCQGAGTIDPLAINLGSSPAQLSSQAQGVQMDLNGTSMDQISWPVQPTQVTFLVNLSNGLPASGAIGPEQIFGNYTVGPDGKVAANGYDALAKYDSNGDGVINSQDSIWSSLRIWQDLNRNGIVDSGELLTLAQAGIQSIELPKTSSSHITKENCSTDQYGNQLCQGHAAYVNLLVNGQSSRKQLIDISFKPLN